MRKAFTLIELLVVIAVIALLSTLSVVALSSARAKSRDARRLSDIKQIQTALEMYLDDAGTYPASLTTGAPLSYGGMVFLASIPGDPLGDAQYLYTQTDGGDNYTLGFTLETKAADYEAGNYQLTPNGVIAGGGGSTPPLAWSCGENLEYGSYEYKTGSSGEYCFMKQSIKEDISNRRCYEDDPGNCKDHGGLYAYGDAMNLCPTGWRLLNAGNDIDVFSDIVDQGLESFKGYYDGKSGYYITDNVFLMTDDFMKVLNISSINVEKAPSNDCYFPVRCIKDPS